MPKPDKVTFVTTASQYVWRVYAGKKLLSERVMNRTELGGSAERPGTVYDDLGKELYPLCDAINACPGFRIMRELGKLQEPETNLTQP